MQMFLKEQKRKAIETFAESPNRISAKQVMSNANIS